MKKYIKIFGIILIIVIAALAFTGCSSKDKNKIKIGIIQNAATDEMLAIIDGFKEEMNNSGLNYEIDIQNASGDTNIANSIARNMVDHNYDLIFSMGTLITQGAVTAVENKIPIVAAPLSDFVAGGIFTDKQNSSKENVTGVTDVEDLDGIISFIKEVAPNAKNIGMVYSSKEANAVYIYDELLKNKLTEQGLTPKAVVISESNEVPLAIDKAMKECDVFVSFFTPTVSPYNDLIVSKAMEAGIPVIGSTKESVEQGFLGAVTLSYYEVGKTSAQKAIQILKGANACDISVENAKGLGIVLNKTTAEKLNIDISKFKDATIVE